MIINISSWDSSGMSWVYAIIKSRLDSDNWL